MAANLLRAGFPLSVWNRTSGRAGELVAAGAREEATPRDVAAASEIVVVCVSDTPDVHAVLFGPDGIAEGARPGSLLVDCSTIDPAATRRFAATLRERGMAMVDAPVSGGSEGAQKGTLTIMVGGEAAGRRAGAAGPRGDGPLRHPHGPDRCGPGDQGGQPGDPRRHVPRAWPKDWCWR